MIFINNLNFETLHLFETSIIGKPIVLQYVEQTLLIVPCYNPIFIDLDNVEKSGKKCFLIFDYLEYFSFYQNIYNFDRTEFLITGKKTQSFFDQNYSNACNKLSSLGISETGVGEFQISILCRNFHMLIDKIEFEVKEINVDLILNDHEIVKHLKYPNLLEVDNILVDALNI